MRVRVFNNKILIKGAIGCEKGSPAVPKLWKTACPWLRRNLFFCFCDRPARCNDSSASHNYVGGTVGKGERGNFDIYSLTTILLFLPRIAFPVPKTAKNSEIYFLSPQLHYTLLMVHCFKFIINSPLCFEIRSNTIKTIHTRIVSKRPNGGKREKFEKKYLYSST